MRLVLTVEAARIGFIVTEQQFRSAFTVKLVAAQSRMLGGNDAIVRCREFRLRRAVLPRPSVAEPQLGQKMNRRRFRAAIVNGDKQQDVVRPGLRVFHEHVEIAVVVQDAGVEQFKLRRVFVATPVLLDELRVGEFPLRILVEHLQIGVRRRGVEVVVKLLRVLAMIALAVRQAKDAFLENRIFAVPQREREAEPLRIIADAGDAILAPAIGATSGVVMREVFPRIAVG